MEQGLLIGVPMVLRVLRVLVRRTAVVGEEVKDLQPLVVVGR